MKELKRTQVSELKKLTMKKKMKKRLEHYYIPKGKIGG
jgi:hypothetical protein